MPASILTVVLVMLFLTVLATAFAITVLVNHVRGERELTVARDREHAEEIRFLVRAVIAKHAGEFSSLELTETAVEREALRLEHLGGFERALREDVDPETGERITPAGMTG